LKKAIELSVLCGQDMMMVIFDKEKQKLYEYTSSAEFDAKVVHKLTNSHTRLQFKSETYHNSDYGKFIKGKERSDDGSL